jgi:hypothetical protein
MALLLPCVFRVLVFATLKVAEVLRVLVYSGT